MGLLVGIDIGGTFTDIVVCDLSEGGIRAGKVATTPRDYGEGVMNALSACGLSPKAVEEIVHGTTVATNALIQGKVAPCGLITTRGFRDLLDLRRRDRPVPFGRHPPFEPLIPRSRRVEVNERAGSDGRVVIRVDEEEALSAARRLIDMGAECIAISFLHGPKGENERKAAECIRNALPSIPVSVGGEVCPGCPEFERTSTAASNAAVTPLVRDYLDRVSASLSGEGFTGILRLVESDGSLLPEDSEQFQAISTALSGPSAGVLGAAALCRSLGFKKVVVPHRAGVFSACGGLTIRVSEDKMVKLMSRDGTGKGPQSTEDAKIGERAVHFGDKFYQSDLYDRERLPEGANLHGPAIVEESGSTTSIPPGTMAEVVAGGHLVMEIE